MAIRRTETSKTTLQVPLVNNPRKSKRSSTQPSQHDFYIFKESLVTIKEESLTAAEELRKLRNEIKKNEELIEAELYTKSLTKELEVINMLRELQTEMKELNSMINLTHEKIKSKESENNYLKEGIIQMKSMYENDQAVNCTCNIF